RDLGGGRGRDPAVRQESAPFKLDRINLRIPREAAARWKDLQEKVSLPPTLCWRLRRIELAGCENKAPTRRCGDRHCSPTRRSYMGIGNNLNAHAWHNEVADKSSTVWIGLRKVARIHRIHSVEVLEVREVHEDLRNVIHRSAGCLHRLPQVGEGQ